MGRPVDVSPYQDGLRYWGDGSEYGEPGGEIPSSAMAFSVDRTPNPAYEIDKVARSVRGVRRRDRDGHGPQPA